MASSQGLKHRPKDERIATATTPSPTTTSTKNRKTQRMAMAKRGLRSLGIAVAVPAVISIISSVFAGNSLATGAGSKPSWIPPLWAIHLACLSASSLLGLSAWLMWADGGFHSRTECLPLYLAELLMGLAWAPLVFRLGATRVGMAVCVAHFAALYMLSRSFGRVNPIAADLVKPYLAWVSFLAVFNYKLL